MDAFGQVTFQWFGCATWRVRVAGLTLWFDTFMDRPAAAPPVGLSARDVTSADWIFISHAHFDHILGATTIARRTGAHVVGNRLSMETLRQGGVPVEHLWPVSGGEPFLLADGVTVTALPSFHSCQWALGAPDGDTRVIGGAGTPQQERVRALRAFAESALDPRRANLIDPDLITPYSLEHGGQIMYLLETPEGSILLDASVGMWSGILGSLRADVAVLAIGGRPTVDGEPFQGSGVEFTNERVELVGARRVVLQHHDAFWPPVFPGIDPGPFVRGLHEHLPGVDVIVPELGRAMPLLA